MESERLDESPALRMRLRREKLVEPQALLDGLRRKSWEAGHMVLAGATEQDRQRAAQEMRKLEVQTALAEVALNYLRKYYMAGVLSLEVVQLVVDAACVPSLQECDVAQPVPDWALPPHLHGLPPAVRPSAQEMLEAASALIALTPADLT